MRTEVIITDKKEVIKQLKQRRADAFVSKESTKLRTVEVRMEGRLEAYDEAIGLLEQR